MDKAKIEELYGELKAYFYDYKPDDEDFLDEDPDVAEQIETLSDLDPSNEQEYYAAIERLSSFISEWFPDSIDEDEQKEIRDALDAAEKAKVSYANNE